MTAALVLAIAVVAVFALVCWVRLGVVAVNGAAEKKAIDAWWADREKYRAHAEESSLHDDSQGRR